MQLLAVILLSLVVICGCQFNPDSVRHGAVIQTAAEESRLPPHLLNPFYRNPRIRDALARSSWFGEGERPVFSREADKASRRDIFLLLSHAGLLPQQQQQQQRRF